MYLSVHTTAICWGLKKNNTAINLSRESERQEQPRWADGSVKMPQFKKAKKAYNPETINSELEALNKSESLNGEQAKALAKAAKERGKSDGFIAGALVIGIAWASHAATNWVMEKFSKA